MISLLLNINAVNNLVIRKIYTGGAEGYVRIWRTDLGDTQEPDVATEGQDGINSISTSVGVVR